jgi:hypothetical protein
MIEDQIGCCLLAVKPCSRSGFLSIQRLFAVLAVTQEPTGTYWDAE